MGPPSTPAKSNGQAMKSNRNKDDAFIHVIRLLDDIGSPHCVLGQKAAQLQGVRLTRENAKVFIAIQWDFFKTFDLELQKSSEANFLSISISPSKTNGAVSSITIDSEGEASMTIFCRSGTFVASDTHRVRVQHSSGLSIFCRSLQAILQGASGGSFGSLLFAMGPETDLVDPVLARDIEDYFEAHQREVAAHNLSAWGDEDAYDAWIHRFGPPQEAAMRILEDTSGYFRILQDT